MEQCCFAVDAYPLSLMFLDAGRVKTEVRSGVAELTDPAGLKFLEVAAGLEPAQTAMPPLRSLGRGRLGLPNRH